MHHAVFRIACIVESGPDLVSLSRTEEGLAAGALRRVVSFILEFEGN